MKQCTYPLYTLPQLAYMQSEFLHFQQEHHIKGAECVAMLDAALQKQYETDYAALYAPYDQQLIDNVLSVMQQKMQHKPSYIIVIGIGGSSLGAKAVYSALCYDYDEHKNARLVFLETVEEYQLHSVQRSIEKAAHAHQKVVVVAITKSGTTTETIVNFNAVESSMQQWYPTLYKELIVIISDQQSSFYIQACHKKYTSIAIPTLIGGRFSVFFAVGLLPLALAGIDIERMCQGARDAGKIIIGADITHNHALQSAITLLYYYQKDYRVYDTFVFSTRLEDLGKWHRQLVGESLGKEYDSNGSYISAGFLPTVSVGTHDLHSVAQFYLSGQRNMYTEFIAIQDREYSVMQQFVQAVQSAYTQKNKPYAIWLLPELNAYYIGYYMYTKMVETMILADFLNINAFDQPAVELYKKEMKQSFS